MSVPHGDIPAPVLTPLDALGLEDLVPTVLRVLRPVGGVGVRLLVADVEERVLEVWDESWAGPGGGPDRVPIEGSVHGRVYRTTMLERSTLNGRPQVIGPVSARGERVGVLEVTGQMGSSPEIDRLVAEIGLLVGYIALAADRWTDELHTHRRRREMSLPAEIQWGLLPLTAITTPRVAVAGALEPAYDVGGDAFDYACDRSRLTIAIFDAMGHGLRAARLSALAVAVFRNARRRGEDLEEQGRAIHATIASRLEEEGFVTGQLLHVDLVAPERSRIVNAGHPPPMLQEADGSITVLEPDVDPPFGVTGGRSRVVQPLPLRPGQRLVLYSDGIPGPAGVPGEAGLGEEEMSTLLVSHRSAPAREAARRLVAAVRDKAGGDLHDDATVVIIDVPARDRLPAA